MKFRLVEYLDIPPVDYGTGTVVGDDIFDKSTHAPFYDDLIDDPEYMKRKYNLKGEIVKMSPNEYFSDCATYIFPTSTVELLKQSRGGDKEDIEYLKKLITEYKKRLFLPYINYAEQQQEGLHRMYAAGELFGWDHKFPVLVVHWADEEMQNKEI